MTFSRPFKNGKQRAHRPSNSLDFIVTLFHAPAAESMVCDSETPSASRGCLTDLNDPWLVDRIFDHQSKSSVGKLSGTPGSKDCRWTADLREDHLAPTKVKKTKANFIRSVSRGAGSHTLKSSSDSLSHFPIANEKTYVFYPFVCTVMPDNKTR